MKQETIVLSLTDQELSDLELCIETEIKVIDEDVPKTEGSTRQILKDSIVRFEKLVAYVAARREELARINEK